MTDITVVIDVGQNVKNARGEIIRDRLDPPPGQAPDAAPDLTLGSLLANGLYLGITGGSPKDTLKYYQMAGKIEDALKPANEGKWQVTRAELDQIEEYWQKINVPVFTLPIYSGFIQHVINETKLEMLALEKAAKEKKPETSPE